MDSRPCDGDPVIDRNGQSCAHWMSVQAGNLFVSVAVATCIGNTKVAAKHNCTVVIMELKQCCSGDTQAL